MYVFNILFNNNILSVVSAFSAVFVGVEKTTVESLKVHAE